VRSSWAFDDEGRVRLVMLSMSHGSDIVQAGEIEEGDGKQEGRQGTWRERSATCGLG
jgi:hypothetical protein